MERIGWKTIEAADGEEAVRTHRDYPERIDLLLFDYLMPKMNGLEAARRIRSRNPKLPVIMMSGFTDEATVESFQAEGLEHLLRKPFQFQALRDLLRTAFAPAP
jgi:CheY-like chemotaxis protein